MRKEAESRRIQQLMETLGALQAPPTRLYFTGGATAVLLGWRATTIDVDLRFVPESDEVYRALPRIKETLEMNIELAWPPDFIPELAGWQQRCLYIARHGEIAYFHYDLYSQALSKLERSHSQDAAVIDAEPHKLIDEAKAAFARNEPGEAFDSSDSGHLLGALGQAGILAAFDAESDTIPSDHHRLILEIAQASRGRFSPQWPVQVWHQKRQEDYEAPYTVQFVFQGRLFRTRAENYGDWYDVESVLRLINFALEVTGQPERYINLKSDGQTACLVFADPNAFIPIAQKYGLPLSDDASHAMRQGLEFERKVRQALEK